LYPLKFSVLTKSIFKSSEIVGFSQTLRRGSRQLLSTKIIVCAIGLSFAFGAVEASARQTAAAAAITQSALQPGEAIQDLGALQPAPDADNPTPASTPTVSSAEPVPELPTWAMILLCFAGLGLAGLKRGRKDRLSPGID
jgi:hypothetical protein